MTTNWREKLINKSFMPSGISLDYADADRRIMTEDALTILREARRAAFKEAELACDEENTESWGDTDDTSAAKQIADKIRALAEKES